MLTMMAEDGDGHIDDDDDANDRSPLIVFACSRGNGRRRTAISTHKLSYDT